MHWNASLHPSYSSNVCHDWRVSVWPERLRHHLLRGPPRWPTGKGVRLQSVRSRVRIPLAPRFFRGRVILVTETITLQWLPCQAPGVIGSALGLVGPVSVYCDWVRWKVWSATSISVWQHVKLSEQIRPWDALACCWDVKQPTNKQLLRGGTFETRARGWLTESSFVFYRLACVEDSVVNREAVNSGIMSCLHFSVAEGHIDCKDCFYFTADLCTSSQRSDHDGLHWSLALFCRLLQYSL